MNPSSLQAVPGGPAGGPIARFPSSDQLWPLALANAEGYARADPFPHAVFDDLFDPRLLDPVVGEFEDLRATRWQEYDRATERKLACGDDEQLRPHTRALVRDFNSKAFVGFLERLTGIEGLIPDPWLTGGGLHGIERGGFLKVHADFNRNDRLRLDRRLNVLLYLNRDWKEEYGGHLELWDREMSRCVQRVLPAFNRCVVFSTDESSFHGHPDPLTCPPGWARKSIALYYYSNGRPAPERAPAHTTAFQSRPGERFRSPTHVLAHDLLPPMVLRGLKRVARLRRVHGPLRSWGSL